MKFNSETIFVVFKSVIDSVYITSFITEMYQSFSWPKNSADTETKASVPASIATTSNSVEASGPNSVPHSEQVQCIFI